MCERNYLRQAISLCDARDWIGLIGPLTYCRTKKWSEPRAPRPSRQAGQRPFGWCRHARPLPSCFFFDSRTRGYQHAHAVALPAVAVREAVASSPAAPAHDVYDLASEVYEADSASGGHRPFASLRV